MLLCCDKFAHCDNLRHNILLSLCYKISYMAYPKVLQLPLELGVPVVGVVAVPAPVEDRVVRREVGRVGVGAGLGTGGVLRQ